MDKKLQDILTEQQVLQDETKAKLEREVLELRSKLASIVDVCAAKVHSNFNHRVDCRCLSCHELHTVKQNILKLKI